MILCNPQLKVLEDLPENTFRRKRKSFERNVTGNKKRLVNIRSFKS